MALSAPSTDPNTLIALETSDDYKFRTFTAETAWTLGTALRTRLLSLPASQRKPALISIALATATSPNPPHILFQSATESGTIPDNENWVRRKRNTVLRWGVSSWAMRMKVLAGLGGAAGADSASAVEEAFVKKFALASSSGGAVADEFAIHGGGYPIRVRGWRGLLLLLLLVG
ncbi:uncharacterized protein N7496_003322 [Penicillium cataractarum]|uniref:Uncharacterized protein n=1 Tax=Penicillium cataractarum TaxID=2100454 RepID=A0A9W9SND5_9EURO|nr:uncharacterized protein N7496_003322 [Penicillium cataractarum]KAJ5380894.1 hypothetical protein N7496_003322 [Penicillium cataractarum]